MRALRAFILAGTIGAAVLPAQAVTLTVVENPKPHADLRSFTVSADAGAGHKLATIDGLTITGPVHQVWPSATLNPSGRTSNLSDFVQTETFYNDWRVFDTHLLVPGANILAAVGGMPVDLGSTLTAGPVALTPTGSPWSFFPARTGFGSFGVAVPTNAFSLTPAAQQQVVPLLQIVTGLEPELTVSVQVTLLGSFPPPAGVHLDRFIPEPAVALALGAGLIGLGLRRLERA